MIRVTVTLMCAVSFLLVFLTPGAGEVIIGSVKPLTGRYSSWITPYCLGEKLALHDMGYRLLNQKVKFRVLDNGGNPFVARLCVSYFASVGAVAILGSPTSGLALAEAGMCERLGIVYINPAATNPKVTEGKRWAFRICPADDVQGKAAAVYVVKAFKPSKVLILVDMSEEYCRGLASIFEREIRRVLPGVSIVRDVYVGGGPFGPIVLKIKKLSPDVIYMPGYSTDALRFLQEMAKAGLEIPVVGGDSFDSPSVRNFRYPGTVAFTTFWAEEKALENEKAREFWEEFKKVYGRSPTRREALGYDAVLALAEAVRRARSLEKEKVRQALEGLKVNGVSGSFVIDPISHNAIRPVIVKAFKNGRLTGVETISF